MSSLLLFKFDTFKVKPHFSAAQFVGYTHEKSSLPPSEDGRYSQAIAPYVF